MSKERKPAKRVTLENERCPCGIIVVMQDGENEIECIYPLGHEGPHYCPAEIIWNDGGLPSITESAWLSFPPVETDRPDN